MAGKKEEKKEAKNKEEAPVSPKKVVEVAMQELKKQAYPYKVSKIMMFPTRKVNLGNYSSVDLSAGFEIVFDEPQTIDSEVITDAFAQVRAKVQKEFREQMNAFGSKKEAPKKE